MIDSIKQLLRDLYLATQALLQSRKKNRPLSMSWRTKELQRYLDDELKAAGLK